jgi:5' nucleotidase, deoxy (Pyrimidine), cytosolic type C protein (NT5C)
MIKIYLDMDGVLANLHKTVAEKYGASANSSREIFHSHWNDLVASKTFESLEPMPDIKELLSTVESHHVPIEILSSSGGMSHHDEVKRQKLAWLKSHGINYPANIVPGGKRKADFAKPDTILIDDAPHVIKPFVDAGGWGILHTSAAKTSKDLSSLINLLKKEQ